MKRYRTYTASKGLKECVTFSSGLIGSRAIIRLGPTFLLCRGWSWWGWGESFWGDATRLCIGVSGGSGELFREGGTRLRVGVSRGLLRRTSARRRVRGVTEGGSCCDSGVVGLETLRRRCMCRRACWINVSIPLRRLRGPSVGRGCGPIGGGPGWFSCTKAFNRLRLILWVIIVERNTWLEGHVYEEAHRQFQPNYFYLREAEVSHLDVVAIDGWRSQVANELLVWISN